MSLVNFLEAIANNVHYSSICNELLHSQSDNIKLAFLQNNSRELQKQISDIDYFADNIMVI